MQENKIMKYSFVLLDIATGKQLFVDSVTDLGNPGSETNVIVRKDNIKTRYHVIVLKRKLIHQT